MIDCNSIPLFTQLSAYPEGSFEKNICTILVSLFNHLCVDALDGVSLPESVVLSNSDQIIALSVLMCISGLQMWEYRFEFARYFNFSDIFSINQDLADKTACYLDENGLIDSQLEDRKKLLSMIYPGNNVHQMFAPHFSSSTSPEQFTNNNLFPLAIRLQHNAQKVVRHNLRESDGVVSNDIDGDKIWYLPPGQSVVGYERVITAEPIVPENNFNITVYDSTTKSSSHIEVRENLDANLYSLNITFKDATAVVYSTKTVSFSATRNTQSLEPLLNPFSISY
jgi:hypothetical protein